MTENVNDSFGTKSILNTPNGPVNYFSLQQLEDKGMVELKKLPFSIKILLENLIRNEDGRIVTSKDIEEMCKWNPEPSAVSEVPFKPARVLMQDFTGVPAVVDMAVMRNTVKRLNANPEKINPHIPVELIIDHSVQVDRFGCKSAFDFNCKKEFERNKERYAFLRWGQKSLKNFKVVPPATGICHQVNLEYLARVIFIKEENGEKIAFPDTVVGLDSHTTMINGTGVMGWGVGGIEAEAVMLGQAYYMLTPQVIGFKLTGSLPEKSTATDLVLTITQLLREKGVVGKFVEFYGHGLDNLTLADRATIANMAPEYGATMGFFPVDSETLNYLKLTGRTKENIDIIEAYCKEQGIFRTENTPDPVFTDIVEFDMSNIKPSLAGPKYPKDRIPMNEMKEKFLKEVNTKCPVAVKKPDMEFTLDHGAVVIAAITSCTNTSNPSVLLGAGILAKKAVERGINVKPWVKTSLGPGSKVVTDYLKESGLLKYLEALRFHVIAYGCTSCIGNSGPLDPAIVEAIKNNDLITASVSSGNRNFEGRISPLTLVNYLTSPILVVAYAIAGTVNINLEKDPIAIDPNGEPVYLHELWPDSEEIKEALKSVKPEMFLKEYGNAYEGNDLWKALPISDSELYEWKANSTYIKKSTFFDDMTLKIPDFKDIKDARLLVLLKDGVTTDHISPAGVIPLDSPAADYLKKQGVIPDDFNSYGSRRGNHEVMMRGTFGNLRLQNKLVPGVEGGWTVHFPSNGTKKVSIYDAAIKYKQESTPLIVIAGKEYGTGSSRDWAAKGTFLLGIRAVIAESFERIHRSNLVGMGVLPLQFLPGQGAESLKLNGEEIFNIRGISEGLEPHKEIKVSAIRKDGFNKNFQVIVRLDSPVEVDYYRHGGILAYVLRDMIKNEN
ncbi:aconitate hydratase 1 [Candidatus Magnetomoraceae bacterium gMMP-13]